MTLRLLLFVLRVLGAVVFLAAIVWPTLALLSRCVWQAEPPQGGFDFSARQLGLLWRSVWLSLSATVLCLALAIPGTYVLGSVRRFSQRPLIIGALMHGLQL